MSKSKTKKKGRVMWGFIYVVVFLTGDFVPVRLCTSRQGAAVGQTDAGKSSRTLAPFHVAGRERLEVWRLSQ